MGFVAGQQITPALRLVRPLGQGAMGSVWVADHLSLGAQVAVKFMAAVAAQDEELVARFRREAAASAQIKSPHIVQVFDHGVAADGSLYIVMELLEGEDLKSRIDRGGPLPPEEVARVVSQTARALGKAHQLGIVHRDVKPANLFLLDLDGEPFVKILDFGIAKQRPVGDMDMTATGSLLGTPHFMSPEQFMSAKHVDHHADLWALGVVAYQALTGKLPFTGETLGALVVAVHAGGFARPSELRRELPVAVDAWMARALDQDPSRRFGSAKEMARALDQAVGRADGDRASLASWGEFASVPPAALAARGTGASESHARTLQGMAGSTAGLGARRRPASLTAMGFGALLLIGGGVFVATRAGSRGEPVKVEVSAAIGSEAAGNKAAADTPAALPGSAAPAPAAPGSSELEGPSKSEARDTTSTHAAAASPAVVARATPPRSGAIQDPAKPSDTSAVAGEKPGPVDPKPGSSGRATPEDTSMAAPEAPPPAPPVLAEFNRGAADAALGAAASAVSKCKEPDGPVGTGTIRVVFAPSGKVTSTQVIGAPFAGTSVGGCVAVTFRSAHVPPFAGAATSLTKPFTIN